MNFIDNLKSNQSLLEKYYNEGTYSIVSRPLPDHTGTTNDDGTVTITSYSEPYKPVWYFTPNPTWNWDKYEYRAYAYVETFDTSKVVSSLFVFSDSDYTLYWNSVGGKFEPTTVNRQTVNPYVKKLANTKISDFVSTLKDKSSTLEGWFTNGKYSIFYRPLPEYSIAKGHYLEPETTSWNFIASPTWDWDNYEYRAYSYKEDSTDSKTGKTVKGLNTDGAISSLFVFNYNGNLYFNSVEGYFEKVPVADSGSYINPTLITLSISGLKSYIENLKDQASVIKGYSDEGLYSIIYRPLPSRDIKKGHYYEPETKSTWAMISKPTWNWDKYEYRAFKPVKDIPSAGTLDPLFVYGYGYNVYYNSVEGGFNSAQVMETGYINGTGLNGTIYNKISLQGDVQVFKQANVTTSNDTSLNFIGKTYKNFENTVNGVKSDGYGPKITFCSSDKSDYVSIVYTDKATEFIINNTTKDVTSPVGVVATDVLNQSSSTRPTIRFFHNNSQAVSYFDKASFNKVTALTENATTYNVPTVTAIRANITNLWLWNTADVLFPVGSYYWSSDATNPGTLFQGTWEQITGTFLWATSTTSDGDLQTATAGEATHTLTTDEIPSHNHTLTDPTHAHSIIDPTHTHPVNDPGHVHTITDRKHKHDLLDPSHDHSINDPGHRHKIYADDMNISWQWDATGWACGYDACSSWGGWGRYFYTQTEKTGITINTAYSNMHMDYATSEGEIQLQANMAGKTDKASTNIVINGALTNITIDNNGGSKPHNNMPPYINCYCWHRIA